MRKWKALGALLLVVGLLLTQKNNILDLKRSTELPPEELLREALMNQQDNIFLLYYQLSEQELYDLFNHVAYNNADLFFVDSEYNYTTIGDTVLSLQPQYKLQGEALAVAQTVYYDALDAILACYDPTWSQTEIALFFHDYLCMYYSYDESLTYYTAYDMLTEGKGVCHSYALLYAKLLEHFGIDCTYVASAEMNHAWNIVTIDGVKYNVDVTFDDPTSDKRGRANHTYFLLSDEALSEDHSFTAAEGYGQCNDTRYDKGAVWENVKTGFIPANDGFYYIQSGMLYYWDGSGEPIYIDTIYATWFTGLGNDSYWKGNHSTLWEHEGRVLYSKPKQILSYTPVSGTFAVEYTYEGEGDIYGFSYIDDVLVLQIGTTPNEPGTLVTVENFQFA